MTEGMTSLPTSALNSGSKNQSLHRFSKGCTQDTIKITSLLRGTLSTHEDAKASPKISKESRSKRISLIHKTIQKNIHLKRPESFESIRRNVSEARKFSNLAKSKADDNFTENLMFSSKLPELNYLQDKKKLKLQHKYH